MIEKENKLQAGMTDEELSEVSGGDKTIYEYNFYDIESKSQKAGIKIVDEEVKESWGLEKLNDRDKAQLSDKVKKKVGL